LGTAVVVPGLGIVVAGPLAAGLAGAGGGGIAGGIIGALVGAGIPKETADKYEQGVKEGEIVVAVQLRNEEDGRYFEDEWRRHNVYPEGKTMKTRSENKARAGAGDTQKQQTRASPLKIKMQIQIRDHEEADHSIKIRWKAPGIEKQVTRVKYGSSGNRPGVITAHAS
jgi:hypothetical protein